ncbi:MAG: DegT/DnrJ/EryC1/StrS family aminotransferase [Methylacidiphilales bacterium]|nr:DegT/DnrJ/EryC1/StrS family aminotransferase [Candidatus Methylacidiphilales bacterium]
MSENFLPFSRPTISEAAIQEVSDCLRSGWITTGPRVQKFEAMLSDYFQTPGVQCCTSATAGLFMALLALDLKPGDEVITSSMTFAATLNCIVLAGGTPKLVDINRSTLNMEPDGVAAAITPRTKAVMPVHFSGLPVDMDPLYALAKKHGLRVIEDAAHAIGTEYHGKRIGSFGDTQVFSFHPNKNMTTGEGGCIVTRDPAMQKRVNLLRFHGIDREAWARFSRQGSPQYDISLAGYKFNMMDMQAALGIHQLPALDGFIEKRTALAMRYYELLGPITTLALPGKVSYRHRHAWHLFTVLVDADRLGFSRDDFMQKLKEHDIGTGLHYQAVHLSSYYQKNWGFKRGDFPNAEHVSDRIASLPLFPLMTEQDQDRVVAALKKVCQSA